MHKKLLILFLLVSPAMAVHAQSTPAKKALVVRILKVQQPGIEGLSRAMAERPAVDLVERAGAALPDRVAPDKREAVSAEIQADVKKYLDEVVPLVTSRAVKLAPTTVGPFLEEKFTEDELKQIAAFLESPAVNKYQQLRGDMQKVLMEKLLADTRGAVEPKVVALEQSVSKRLGILVPTAATPAGPAR
jgi:hypothetical protein